MTTLLDAMITLEHQGRFTAAMQTMQELLASEPALVDQAALTLRGGLCAIKQGGAAGHEAAQAYFERARELYEQLGQPDMVAMVLAEHAMGHVRCGGEHALQIAMKKLHEAETLQGQRNCQVRGKIAHYRAVVYDRLGEKAHAFEHFTRAHELLQDDRSPLAEVLDDLGTYYVSLGKPHLARSCYNQAIAKKAAQGDTYGQAVTYGHLGDLLVATQDYAEATTVLRKAIAGGLHTENTREVTHQYTSLAEAYMGLRDYCQAAQALETCIRLATQHHCIDDLASTYVSQARLLHHQGDLTLALAVLREQAIPVFRACLDAPGLAAARQHEGRILQAMGHRQEAIEALREAAYLYRESLRARDLVIVTLELARLYMDNQHEDDARQAVRTALDLAEKLGDTQLVRWSDELLECLDPKEAVQRAFRRVDGQDMGSRSFLLGGQREFLTVLMSDIVSFTDYVAHTELQEVTQTLNDYFTLMTDIVIRHHGYVDKYVGDGLMAIFREVPGIGYHANRAVYAALEMLERLRDLNKERTLHHQAPLHIRLGIHSGTAIIGNIGCYGKMDYTAIGTAVILASRLEVHASPDSICISDATYQLLGGYFHAVPLSPVVPKGFAEPQRVWQVLGKQPLLKFALEFSAAKGHPPPHPGTMLIAVDREFEPEIPAREPQEVMEQTPLRPQPLQEKRRLVSAAARIADHPEVVLEQSAGIAPSPLTFSLPRRPDFDAIVAAYWVQALLETGHLPPGTPQLVEYVRRVLDLRLPVLPAVWNTPYGVFLGIHGRNARYCREHALSHTQRDLYNVQRTFYLIQFLLERLAVGVNLVHPEAMGTLPLFEDQVVFQPPFEREREFVLRDATAYDEDLRRARTLEVTLPVLGQLDVTRQARTIVIEHPMSTLFASWAHYDPRQETPGFDLVVLSEPDRRYSLSINAASGVCLRGLRAALERPEGVKRRQSEAEDYMALSLPLPGTGGTWDDRGALGYSLVETRRQGSALTLEDVLQVVQSAGRWMLW